MASKDPNGLLDILTNKHKFKIKGTGTISCHLDCDFGRDDYGTLHFIPLKCVEKMTDMFGSKPKLNCMSPLKKGDYPEL